MGIPYLEDQWPTGDGIMMIVGVSTYGDGFVSNWDEIDGFSKEIRWISKISKIWILRNLCVLDQPCTWSIGDISDSKIIES